MAYRAGVRARPGRGEGWEVSIYEEVESLTREEKCIAYCLGSLVKLKEAGLVDGGRIRPTEKGELAYEILHDSGFTMTPEEVRNTMRRIMVTEREGFQ